MKQNPFYGLSAAAMLGGCLLVSEALKPEPGHLGKLLGLVAVLQVYEALLLGLGLFLVATARAPRDGVMVLMLETLFLLDAPLLATECVTADARAGALLALALLGLAAGKLALVRRALPGTLPVPVAIILGGLTLLVLGLPVVASQLAAARILGPVSLYGLWWLTLALPLAQGRLAEAAPAAARPSAACSVWSWLPATSVLFHLWAIGWIHQVPSHPAFLAPFLLGLALATGRDAVARQIVLPVLAVLVSLGQSSALGHVLSTPTGAPVSVLKLALLGAGATYAALAWRHGYRWLVALAALCGGGVLGGGLPSVFDSPGSVFRFVARLIPGGALGWGATSIGAAFALLALGAWRSLGGDWPGAWRHRRRGDSGRDPRRSHQGAVTTALFAGLLATGTAASAWSAHPVGHPRQRSALLDASLLAAAAVVVGARARPRLSPREDRAAQTVARLGVGAGALALLLSVPGVVALDHHRIPRAESAVIGDIRSVQSAQGAYRDANGGFVEGRLACLAEPSTCLPDHPEYTVPFLAAELASGEVRKGYVRSFHPGPAPDSLPPHVSSTSVETFAYVAVPQEVGYTGARGFCGDSRGNLCFTTDGSEPPLLEDGTCDLSACFSLE